MKSVIILALCLVAWKASVAQEPHEQPPVLKAGDILKPEFLSGPSHKVRESVPTYSGANRFSIESRFGPFEADGNYLLETRIVEIGALEKLKQMSGSEEYQKALAKAAKSPITFAENLVKDPVKTASGVPKGAYKLISRVGQGVKKAVEGDGGDAGDTATSAIGMQSVKRELAAELGVDPYSTNHALQEELNKVAWASFSGGATIKVLMFPLSGGVFTAAKVASTGSDLQQVLKEKSPADLEIDNSQKLAAMGVPKDVIQKFVSNRAISPLHQTQLVRSLVKVEDAKGRDAFVRAAAESAEDEQDAIFWDLTARLIADLHAQGPKILKIVLLDGFPVSVAENGTVVVALHWDYACWTPLADRFSRAVLSIPSEGKTPGYRLALSGIASSRLRKELETRGFAVQDRMAANVLK